MKKSKFSEASWIIGASAMIMAMAVACGENKPSTLGGLPQGSGGTGGGGRIVNPPVISSFYPNSGPQRGRTSITIYGYAFASSVTVSINGVPCSVTSSNDWRIMCNTGSSPTAGSFAIQVTNSDGGTASSSSLFQYIGTPPSPPPVDPDPRVADGTYAGSEAEALVTHYAIRRGRTNYLDSVNINGVSINIWSTVAQEAWVYTIHHRDDGVGLINRIVALPTGTFRFTRTGNDLIIGEREVQRLPDDLPGDIVAEIGMSVERGQAGVNPDFVERPTSQIMQDETNRIRARIDQRIRELDHSPQAVNGYYQNPQHGGGIVLVQSNNYDIARMTAILNALRDNQEDNFVADMVLLGSSFPRDSATMRRAFIDSFTTLYVTKRFPSIGARANFMHFILRCGQLY